jgi:hypothetical protein
MPHMTNGVGTWFCKAHFDAGWGWDDAVECAMFLYFPVWPLGTLHVRELRARSFAPEEYQAIPLRWSIQLVRFVFLQRWLAGLVGLGLVLLLTLAVVIRWPPQGRPAAEWAVLKPIVAPLAPCLIAGGIIGQLVLRYYPRKERDIRRVLGPHSRGSSDPATWLDEDLARMPTARLLFGTETFGDAVPRLLTAGARAAAMWAARLSAARESRTKGAELTDTVLRDPDVQEALSQFRRDPSCWRTAMGVEAYIAYQAQGGLAESHQLFDPALAEQTAQRRTAEHRDAYVAGVAALLALIGLGLGAWFGGMVSIQVALLSAVLGSFVGAAAGILLAMVTLRGS